MELSKTNLKVSIIIPVCNAEFFLPQCLNSIISQDYDNWETVLVDDGSTDSSGVICDSFAQKDNRIKVIHQQNQGSSAARNTGLMAAEGDYICWVDSDDWIDSCHLSQLCLAAVHHNADVVLSAFVYERNCISEKCLNKPSAFHAETIIKENLVGLRHAGVVFTFAKRQLYRERTIKFPEDNFFEDMYVSCSLVYYADRIAYSSSETYHYRIHPFSMTQDNNACSQIQRYFEFSRNVSLLFTDLQLWQNETLVNALNERVISQKIYLFQFHEDRLIDKVLSSSFPQSHHYYKVNAFPDVFLYLTFRLRKVWPFRLLKRIQRMKNRIAKH